MGKLIFALSIFRVIPAGQVGVKVQYLARRDGKLPQYTFGGNAVPFVQLPGAGGR
jgi:hypothetical protein